MPVPRSEAILTVDAVLLTLVADQLHVALVKRERAPYKGHWALPGGYIHVQEDDNAKAAAARVLRDKTGITSPYLEEFGTVSGPSRDPRGWSLSVVYYALVPPAVISASVSLFPVNEIPDLPFLHQDIVRQVIERVRSKSSYSSLPVHLCPKEFTIPELHRVYESVLGEKLGMANFRRKLDDLGILEEVQGAARPAERHRPAQLYRVTPAFQQALSVRDRGM